MNQAICPICGEVSKLKLDLAPSPLAAQGFSDQFKATSREVLDVFECVRCLHVFLNCSPVEYHRSVIRSTSVSETMQDLRYQQGHELANLCSPWLEDRPKIFELGAHQNENLETFEQIGFDTFGCEYIDGTCDVIVGDHTVWDFSLDSDALPSFVPRGGFDAACTFNFLEHFENPKSGVNALFELLKPGGFALIEVPNFDYISATGLITEFIADHLHYFSRKSLSKLLVDSGFSIHRISSIFDGYILSAIVEKNNWTDWSYFLRKRHSLLNDLNIIFDVTSKSSKPLFLWGCGHQSMFMLTHYNVSHFFTAIVDSSDKKIGKFPIGIELQVIAPDTLKSFESAYILVCAGGFNNEIIKQIESYDSDFEIFEVLDGAIRRVR